MVVRTSRTKNIKFSEKVPSNWPKGGMVQSRYISGKETLKDIDPLPGKRFTSSSGKDREQLFDGIYPCFVIVGFRIFGVINSYTLLSQTQKKYDAVELC